MDRQVSVKYRAACTRVKIWLDEVNDVKWRPISFQNLCSSIHLDSEESLLLAHSTIDAELNQWASTVQRGFQDQGITEAKECERLEQTLKRKKSELKKMQTAVAKMKGKHAAAMEEANEEEKLAAWVAFVRLLEFNMYSSNNMTVGTTFPHKNPH